MIAARDAKIHDVTVGDDDDKIIIIKNWVLRYNGLFKQQIDASLDDNIVISL
jgi:hypothetical protein